MKREMYLTQGPILPTLIKFSLPMILGNFLQQIYNIVDTLVVGKWIGAHALAAVGSTYALMTFLTSIIIGLCMGSGAQFSQLYGGQEIKKFKKNVAHSFVFIALITVLLYVLVLPSMETITRFLQIPNEILHMTIGYTKVIFLGLGFVFLYNFFAYFLRSVGNSMIPLYFLGASSALNIVLDIVFVTRFHYEVESTALATIISQALSGIGLMSYSLLYMRKYLPTKEDLVFEKSMFLHIMKVDMMTSIQQSVMNFGVLMIQGLVNSFGTIIMAAFAAAVKIDTLAYMPAQEFANGYSLFISQNFGAQKIERIKKGTKTAILTSLLFCACISIFVCVFARRLMLVFVDGKDIEIIQEGIRYLRIEGASYMGIGCLFLLYGYFRGIDFPSFSVVLTIVSLGTRVLFAYTFAPHTSLGVIAIWIAIPIGWALADIIGFLKMKKRKL
ncbi:MAG: MATE family efflux transporter [Firmicutes bacterium]|nr:MATE family efflux transporter [Bacillota bacterium]